MEKLILYTLLICDFIFTFFNLMHFINRIRKTHRKEQIFFIELFIMYLVSEAYFLIALIENTELPLTSYMVGSIIILLFVAIAFVLVLKIRIAVFFNFFGIIYGSFYVYGETSGFFINNNIDSYTTTLILMQIFSVLGLIVVGYYFIKTRLSPLLGLFIVQIIGVILGITGFLGDLLGQLVYTLFANITMFLGFKGKLNFFELSDEEKLKRGISIYIGEK